MDLRDWIGRSETVTDSITATPCAALAATLDRAPDRPLAGAELPPLWHWLYFLPLHRQSELGPDGHAERGGFLPPIDLPRRMWAGSQFVFHAPLRIGDTVTRRSAIEDIAEKHGRTGRLTIVRVRHEMTRDGAAAPAITEHHDIVYRAAPSPEDPPPPPPMPAPAEAAWSKTWLPDDVLLFRYSALTFNGHRIHYDRRYVTETEGYPGLVVHAPLVATLQLDLLHQALPDARVAAYRFRAVRPLFDTGPFTIAGQPSDDGRTIRLWAADADGWLINDATATLR